MKDSYHSQNSQDNMICPTKYPLRRSTIPLPSQRSSVPKSSYLLFQALFLESGTA
ncbi:hypothetical protein J008_04212 [Cryptococcus neoformans]|nr:hypothetical protein C349_04363 [Cryptococcus neoformans var. grubii Br795]OXH29692.1 hypothetical protein J008_04212 [Cryptococcus neoformans var. grubii]